MYSGARPERDFLIKRFLFAWGSGGGFVIGAALMALLLRRVGAWPPSEAYLRRFLQASATEERTGDVTN